MGIGFQERDCVFCMSVIAEISEGKENPSCLADMRFFPIVLCSMLHCLEICQGAVSAGGQATYQQVICFGLFFFALWYSSVWWTLSIILFSVRACVMSSKIFSCMWLFLSAVSYMSILFLYM